MDGFLNEVDGDVHGGDPTCGGEAAGLEERLRRARLPAIVHTGTDLRSEASGFANSPENKSIEMLMSN